MATVEDKSKTQLFLAMTALTTCWDTRMPIVFLGHWCMRYSERVQYENLIYHILPDPWLDSQEKLNAQCYIDELHARLLPELARVLNAIHERNHNQRFWEIIIGSWLRIHLAAFYDRYICLTRAYQSYPHLQTIGLTPASYTIPSTNNRYTDYLASDWFNLQLYTHILDYLKIPHKKKYFDIHKILNMNKTSVELSLRVKNIIRRLANRFFLSVGKRNKIVIADSGISLRTLIQLYIKSKFSVLPLTHFDWQGYHYLSIDKEKRNKFADINIGKSDFENCLIKLLPHYIPMAYIESYSELYTFTESLKLNPKVIFSSTGWHYNEAFKYFAAIHNERGSILCGHQHGGDYGILDYHPSERHEIKVTDRFYTWGWSSSKNPHIIPFNSLKLRRKKSKAKIYKDHILYGTANSYRYLFRFNFSISLLMNYYEMQKQFLQTLSPDVQQKLQLRLFHTDWGWDRKERWEEVKTMFKFQAITIPFSKALSACNLYISDHISTTFTESLCVNKPTIIFCNPEMWDVRASAKPYFEDLKDVGIIYDNPTIAAGTINNIYSDINTWWFDKNRQETINKFRQRFCYPASLKLTEWLNEFSRLNTCVATQK